MFKSGSLVRCWEEGLVSGMKVVGVGVGAWGGRGRFVGTGRFCY